MIFEICTDSFETALLAQKHQVKRVELCSALSVGGLTPSLVLTEKCTQLENIETHVMIRVREGDFCYSDFEIELMKGEIERMAQAGVNGVVFGCLDSDNNLNIKQITLLIETAKKFNLETTFHRAFDFANAPTNTLEQLIELGLDRILTSGQKPTAIEGIGLIQKMVKQAGKRIQIMAGSGVNSINAIVLANTGIDALHFPRTNQREVNLLEWEVRIIQMKKKWQELFHCLFEEAILKARLNSQSLSIYSA